MPSTYLPCPTKCRMWKAAASKSIGTQTSCRSLCRTDEDSRILATEPSEAFFHRLIDADGETPDVGLVFHIDEEHQVKV